MAHRYDVDLLHNEKIDLIAKPHILSFFKYYLFSAYLIAIALFLRWLHGYLISDESILETLSFFDVVFSKFSIEPADLVILILFWVIILLSGFSIGVLWVTKMPLVYMVSLAVVGTVFELYFAPFETVMIPRSMIKLLLLSIGAVVAMVLTEGYRRGHLYVITNYRIVTRKGFIRKEDRELFYDKITDVYVTQGMLGRIFNFGTVIPISSSGIGLGADSAQSFTGVATSIKGTTVGGGFAGGKSVFRPRAATYFSLFGVSNPRNIRIIIGNRQLESKEAPILRRIEDLLKVKEGNE